MITIGRRRRSKNKNKTEVTKPPITDTRSWWEKQRNLPLNMFGGGTMQKGGIPTRSTGQGQGIPTGLCVGRDGKCPKTEKAIIEVSLEAVSKVIALLRHYDDEFVVCLYGHDDEDGIRVMEITCPPQVASAASCEIKTGYTPPETLNGFDFLGLAHSHAGMATFWSGTDDKAITNYRVNIEVNKKLDVKAAVREKLECGALMLVDATVKVIVDDVWAEQAIEAFIEKETYTTTGKTGMKWTGTNKCGLPTSISVTLKNGKTMSIDREGTTTSPNGVYILEDGSEILVAAGRVRVDEPIIFVLRDNKQEVALTNDGVCAVDDANDDELEQALVNQYMPMSQYDFYGYGYGVPMGALHKENTDDETWLQRCQELADERRKKHAKNCEELNKSAE